MPLHHEIDGRPSCTGELDFWLSSGLRWGIELLASGDGIAEHLQRFETVYAPLHPHQWRVVDVRSTAVQPQTKHENYVALLVDMDKECRIGTVIFPNRRVNIVFTGGPPVLLHVEASAATTTIDAQPAIWAGVAAASGNTGSVSPMDSRS